MKKYYSLIPIIFFITATILIIRFRTPQQTYGLMSRKNSTGTEWVNSKQAIENLLREIRNNPHDMKSKLKLAYAYIQEGRISGNHAYYDKSALSLCDEILKQEEGNFEALCAKATVLLSQHHFSDAKPLAEKAIQENPYNSTGYGILTDACVELGEYDRAIKMADKMVSIRPDMRSYARVAYLREIFGDYPGAIEAMKLAVSSGYPGYEQTAWTRCQLGKLYENTAQLDKAEMEYELALTERALYPYALAGLGRIAKANGNYALAIKKIQLAKTQVVDFSFDQELTELYRLDNQPRNSFTHAKEVVNSLVGVTGKEGDVNHGHYADKELAYAYLDTYNYSLALHHALIEYKRRPDNIDVNQALALVYYKLGKFNDAEKYIEVAMKTHSKNPVLLYEAGVIKISAGKNADGANLIAESKKINPFIKQSLQVASQFPLYKS
jgi:tetratricopeptide (TPR) repeat protein